MGNDELRAQKKREKQRKKREAARVSRGSRPPPPTQGAPRPGGVKGAERWPVAECYLSETWHEQGARVHAAFVRQHADGRMAAAFFEVDLAVDGVVECLSVGGVTLPQVQGELARRTERAGHGMRVAEPHLVAKVVLTGLAHGRAAGRPDVEELSEALGLLGDIDGSGAPEAVLVGAPPPPAPKKKGLLARLFGG